MEGKFEDKWKDAVDGAEVQPSENVWSSVESALIATENKSMKRQVVFYQRLAAASIIFALLLGALGFYYSSNKAENQMAISTPKKASEPEPGISADEARKQNKIIPNTNAPQTGVKTLLEKTIEGKNLKRDQKNMNPVAQLIHTDSAESVTVKIITPAAVDSSTTDRSAEKSLATLQTEAVGQPESPLKIQKKKEEVLDLSGFSKKDDTNEKEKNPRKNHEDLWASLGLSAGNYNPGSVSGSSLNSPTYGYPGGLGSSPSVSRPGVGSSYSVGLAMGKRVANRWVIQGGISYLNSSSGYTSNMTSSSFSNAPQAFDLYNASVKTSTAVTFTNPYQINSVLEFISIPVQAGYLLVDKKMGFQMNAGVATDFFIRNSLQDQSGQVNSYSQSAGSDSPYRSVNWAGLVSTELSYKVGRQYRISLVPGVRYWFNSSLKSGATSNSYMADLGFRFRYILK